MFQPKFYILVLFLAVAVFTKANHPVDSMRLALDKEAFSIYLDQYIKEQEQSITDKEGLSFAYYFLGNHLLNNNNDSIAAKEIFLTGEKFAQEQNDTTQIIRFKRAFGTYFLYRNQFEESISYYIDGLKLAKATNNLRIAAILTTELARVYYILEDFETAIQYLEEGKSYALKAEDKTLEASI